MQSPLYLQYLQTKQNHPHLYARDIAERLGLSEAELTHARVGHDAQRLQVDARTLISELATVGVTKSITRNSYAIHQLMGRYLNQRFTEKNGLLLNPRGLDLRLFLTKWGSIFSVQENNHQEEKNSIQFYDIYGQAAHKVYLTDETDHAAWQVLIEKYRSADNPPLAFVSPAPRPINNAVSYDAQIDAQWRNMTDIHQFFQLLDNSKLTRQQLFRAVADDLAHQVSNTAFMQILNSSHEQHNEIMIFVSNGACVQIFTGQIEQIVSHPPKENVNERWISVINRRFTLHLLESAIAESWVTRKPTKDGFVTSLELFAADGTQIAQLFGQRAEGQPEQEQWRKQVASLAARNAARNSAA